MIDIKKIIENPELIKQKLAKKGCVVDFADLLSMNEKKRAIILQVEQMKAERNRVSAQIPMLKKEGKDVAPIFASMKKLGEDISALDAELNELNAKIFDFVACLPNLPDDDLLEGEKENNQVVKVYGEKPEFDFKAKNHVDLCTSLNLIDYERGVKLSGGGYWLYRGDGARLEWALLNFFISKT